MSGDVEAAILEVASSKLRHPDDALLFLDATDFAADDVSAIEAAIGAVLVSRPYLGTGWVHDPTAPKQLTQADLKGMTSDEIVAARETGQLDAVQQGIDPETYRRPAWMNPNRRIERADLAEMTPEQINEARESGRLNHLMGR